MKLGRNDPCHCGSGKKYKECHWTSDQEGSGEDSARNELPSFAALIEKYHPDPILKMLGVLQLIAANHCHEAQIEEMARLTFLQRKQGDNRPFASFQMLKSVVEPMGYPDDAPANTFTDNVVFSEGNYIIYPGIYVGITEILNHLLECIFLLKNQLPKEFIKEVKDAAGILLWMSNSVATEKGHVRYMYEDPEYDRLAFPEYNSLVNDAAILTFTKNDIERYCTYIKADPKIIHEFVLAIGSHELNENDPDKNPVGIKPLFLNDEGDFVLYMPTTLHNSLMNFVFSSANKHDCNATLMNMLQEKEFENTNLALSHMGWAPTNIELPRSENELPIREMVFRFDNQKLGYLCFIDTISTKTKQETEPKSIKKRNEDVVDFLSKIEKDQPFQILSLFVLAETGQDRYFMWGRPPIGHQIICFQYREIITLAYSESADRLSLWKFAKAYKRTAEQMRIISIGGTLDSYAIYESNKGSLLHSDRANPIGGTMMIVNGSSNEFFREVQRNRDEHAVLLFTGKQVGFTKVIRPKKYAAVFVDKFAPHIIRKVIEDYKMPIWVCNYDTKEKKSTTWAEIICEAVAFWLQKMHTHLVGVLSVSTLVQFEIEILVDPSLENAIEYEIKDIDPESVVISVSVDAPKIKVAIPFEFLYLAKLPDNTADRMLMVAVLKGIRQYTTKGGKPITLSDTQIGEFINSVLQPSQAKMILFADSSRNVRLDSRNLSSLRYIQETDISFLLDNLVSYLPDGYAIPENIESKDQKIKLCDDVVSVLYEKIKSKIKTLEGEELLQWLIRMQEKCVQVREFNDILIPARIASYSSFDNEVENLLEKEENLVTTSHALRTLIEYVATEIPQGEIWPNNDDIDELLALTNQVINWGASSEALRFNLADPKMGLLPSGRIGSEKNFEREILEPYAEAKAQGDVFKTIEEFEKNYFPDDKRGEEEVTQETKDLDAAFKDEFGITLTVLSKIIGILINRGFEKGDAYSKIEVTELSKLIQDTAPGIASDEIKIVLELLTLIERPELGKPPSGYRSSDIFSWHYTRPLSYLRKPLIRYTSITGTIYIYYGFRHLMMYIDNLFFLLHTGKLPERNSPAMKSWIAGSLEKKGKPYRNEVRDWFKNNTDFLVIDYEVSIKPGGHLEADRDLGDIDVFVVDKKEKIIYSIECKNSVGARNIHEMKTEMDMYLGREGQENKSKVAKHVTRDKWLKENKHLLSKLGIQNTDEYQIISPILTADEIPLPYLRGESIPLPIKSFILLQKDGISVLQNL